MKLFLFRIRTRIGFFYARNRTLMRRIHWACIISIVIAIFAVPISLGIRHPDRVPLITHGVTATSAELIREYTILHNQTMREAGRLHDFGYMLYQLSNNYPFFDIASESIGIDLIDLAWEAHDELYEHARYNITSNFFINFLNERYLGRLGGYGNPRITSEARGAASWLREPYFFGYYDWRFTDGQTDVSVRDDNIYSKILAEGIAYLRVNTFLPKGYMPVTHSPFRYFDFDAEKQHLLDFYGSIYDFDHLIIDIRGIGSGFGDYFLPLILEPNLHAPLNARFYVFHMDGRFANRVSNRFRTWYGFGELVDGARLSQNFTYAMPEHLTHGFPIDITARSLGGAAFGGQIWLMTDSNNFSGPNFMYLQMARDAGFVIVYEENPLANGWAMSFTRLPSSGLSLRYNPLYFTDHMGRPFEKYGVEPHYRLSPGADDFRELLALID